MIKFLLVIAFTIVFLGSLTAQEKLITQKKSPVVAW